MSPDRIILTRPREGECYSQRGANESESAKTNGLQWHVSRCLADSLARLGLRIRAKVESDHIHSVAFLSRLWAVKLL